MLADLDADETRNRHAAAFVQLAERGEVEIRGPHQLPWLERFRADVNNFRASIEWCLLTGDSTTPPARPARWLGSGPSMECSPRRSSTSNVSSTSMTCRRRPARSASGATPCWQRRSAGSRRPGRRIPGRRARPLCGDDANAAYGFNAATVAEWALGNHARSLDAHREAIALLEPLGDAWGLAVCNVLQARTLFDLGDAAA